jgi:hypothetical protein
MKIINSIFILIILVTTEIYAQDFVTARNTNGDKVMLFSDRIELLTSANEKITIQRPEINLNKFGNTDLVALNNLRSIIVAPTETEYKTPCNLEFYNFNDLTVKSLKFEGVDRVFGRGETTRYCFGYAVSDPVSSYTIVSFNSVGFDVGKSYLISSPNFEVKEVQVNNLNYVVKDSGLPVLFTKNNKSISLLKTLTGEYGLREIDLISGDNKITPIFSPKKYIKLLRNVGNNTLLFHGWSDSDVVDTKGYPKRGVGRLLLLDYPASQSLRYDSNYDLAIGDSLYLDETYDYAFSRTAGSYPLIATNRGCDTGKPLLDFVTKKYNSFAGRSCTFPTIGATHDSFECFFPQSKQVNLNDFIENVDSSQGINTFNYCPKMSLFYSNKGECSEYLDLDEKMPNSLKKLPRKSRAGNCIFRLRVDFRDSSKSLLTGQKVYAVFTGNIYSSRPKIFDTIQQSLNKKNRRKIFIGEIDSDGEVEISIPYKKVRSEHESLKFYYFGDGIIHSAEESLILY